MSVEWNVRWCPVSRVTTPRHAKDRFKSRVVKAARETSKFYK